MSDNSHSNKMLIDCPLLRATRYYYCDYDDGDDDDDGGGDGGDDYYDYGYDCDG